MRFLRCFAKFELPIVHRRGVGGQREHLDSMFFVGCPQVGNEDGYNGVRLDGIATNVNGRNRPSAHLPMYAEEPKPKQET